MNIKQVHVKNIHNLKDNIFDFNNITYVYGLNGSGKSTILSAIQFCFLGKFPNTNATNAGILSHRNDTKKPIEVIVTLEDGKNFIEVKRIFDVKKNDLTINPPSYTIEDIVGNSSMMIFDFNEFFNLTGNKKKDYILSILPSNEIDINLVDTLQSLDSYTINCEDIIKDLKLNGYEHIKNLDMFKEINKHLKEDQSAYKANEKSITSTIQSLIYYDDYDGPEDVGYLEKLHDEKYSEYEELIKQKTKNDIAAQNTQKIKDQIDSIDVQGTLQSNEEYKVTKITLEKLLKEKGEIEGKVEYFSSEISKRNSSKNQYERILQSISNSSGTCPILNETCDRLEQSVEKLEYELESCKVNLESLENFLDSWTNELNDKNKEIVKYESKISSLEKSFEQKEYLESQLEDNLKYIEPFDENKLEEIQEEIKSIEESIKQASANASYQTTLNRLHKEEISCKEQIEFLKDAIKITGENGIVSDLSSKPFKDLEEEMSNVQKQLRLNLGDPNFVLEAKANSFDFGFIRSNKLIPFSLLSSGEKCVFSVLFLSSITRISTSKLDLVMIDDLFDHLDNDVFKTIIDNISQISDIQYIIAGVKDVRSSDFLKVINLMKSGGLD